jgi:pyrroloquinoline quinone (PQQ) biosynthesis protein C
MVSKTARAARGNNRYAGYQFQRLVGHDAAVLDQGHAELAILVATSRGLREKEVDQAQAVAHPAVRVAVLDPVHPIHPAV